MGLSDHVIKDEHSYTLPYRIQNSYKSPPDGISYLQMGGRYKYIELWKTSHNMDRTHSEKIIYRWPTESTIRPGEQQ